MDTTNPTPQPQPEQVVHETIVDNSLTVENQYQLMTLAHLSSILMLWAFPIIMLIEYRKTDANQLNRQLKELVNFQTTVFLAYLLGNAATLTAVWLSPEPGMWLFNGLILFIVAHLIVIFFATTAALSTRVGKAYKYPVRIPFLR